MRVSPPKTVVYQNSINAATYAQFESAPNFPMNLISQLNFPQPNSRVCLLLIVGFFLKYRFIGLSNRVNGIQGYSNQAQGP